MDHRPSALINRLVVMVFCLLAACRDGPVYQNTSYALPTTPGGRMCATQCSEARDYCHQTCDLDNRACYNNVQSAAEADYDRYARERFQSHLGVDRLPSDFEHPEACIAAKKSCNADCDRPYNSCYRDCGGQVTVTTSCQFLCFE